MFALYATIWLSLCLFVAGEFGKRGIHNGLTPRSWAWSAFSLGAVLMIVHILLSMSLVHHWSHASSVATTAAQTNAVFGLNWGGGVFVNYLFVAVWIAEIVLWRFAPAQYASRAPAWTRILRIFYFIVIANAAIVFAGGWRRALGVALVALLMFSWRRP